MAYPSRDSHFAHRFCRLLFKTCAAAEIGLDGVALCVHVAHLEDSRHYRGPIRLWNAHLQSTLLASENKVRRIREKCVRAGWLKYERANNRSIAYYWVTIPDEVAGMPDSELEGERELEEMIGQQRNASTSGGIHVGNPQANTPKTEGNVGGIPGGNPGGTSYPIPNPNPNKSREASSTKKTAKGKSRSKAPQFDALSMDLPFDSQDFRESWSDWVAHRNTLKPAYTELAAKRQLNRCEKMGEETAIQQIDRSITSGWKDIFPPKTPTAFGATPDRDTSTEGLKKAMSEKGGYRWAN